MGAKATFNSVTRNIKLTEAPTLVNGEYVVSLDVKKDLYGDMKEDWLSTPELRKVRPPITVIGGQTTPIGFAGNTFFLANDWNVELYDADQILTVDGNFFKSDGTSPFIKPTGGTYSTQIDRFVSNIVDTVATGSGVLASDVTDIRDAVMADNMTEDYPVDGQSGMSISQSLYAITQMLSEFQRTGNSVSIKKRDGTEAFELTLDSDTAPTSATQSS